METSVTKHFFMYGWKKSFCHAVLLLVCCYICCIPNCLYLGKIGKVNKTEDKFWIRTILFWGVVTDHWLLVKLWNYDKKEIHVLELVKSRKLTILSLSFIEPFRYLYSNQFDILDRFFLIDNLSLKTR